MGSKEYAKGYDAGSNNPNRGVVLTILVFGVMLGVFASATTLMLNNEHWVDVEAFGEKICDAQGMSFKDWHWLPQDSGVPVIVCKEKGQNKSIIDGVVVRE